MRSAHDELLSHDPCDPAIGGYRLSGPLAPEWDVLHELFGVGNPPGRHVKPPCCESEMPEIDYDVLDVFLRTLRRFNRGR